MTKTFRKKLKKKSSKNWPKLLLKPTFLFELLNLMRSSVFDLPDYPLKNAQEIFLNLKDCQNFFSSLLKTYASSDPHDSSRLSFQTNKPSYQMLAIACWQLNLFLFCSRKEESYSPTRKKKKVLSLHNNLLNYNSSLSINHTAICSVSQLSLVVSKKKSQK